MATTETPGFVGQPVPRKEDAKLLVPLLTDDTTLRAAAGTNGEIQLRDTALAMAVHLTGRDLKEFGFESRSPLNTTTLSYYNQWFPSDEARTKAFEKWVKLEPTLAPEPKKAAAKPDEETTEEKTRETGCHVRAVIARPDAATALRHSTGRAAPSRLAWPPARAS